MRKIPNPLKILTLICLILSLASCSSRPVSFDAAAKKLATRLLREVQVKSLFAEKNIIVDDFTDEDTGELVSAGTKIERIIFSVAEKKFTAFSLSKMDTKNIREADYLINGVISFEQYKRKGKTKYYQIHASATDLETGKVIASASAWIKDRDLDYTPANGYKESPMYMTDKRHLSKVRTARSLSGTQADSEYYDSLETNALIAEAFDAFRERDYAQTISMLTEASTRSDGQVMKTYSGLYQAYLKEGDLDLAEDAFGKLLDISVESNSFSIKLLFQVNSTKFISDKNLNKRYQIWIRQISKFFKKNRMCAKIVGHSSNTGAEEYNNRLSKQRADAVQKHMKPYYKTIRQQTETLGMGFRENIKGLGTDDGRDSIDRRVEFRVIDCSDLS